MVRKLVLPLLLLLSSTSLGAQLRPPASFPGAELQVFESAGRMGAEQATVGEFRMLSTIPALPLGFTGLITAAGVVGGGPGPSSFFPRVALAAAVITGATLLTARAYPDDPIPEVAAGAVSFDAPGSREAFERAYRARVRERRLTAAGRGALTGALIGAGAAVGAAVIYGSSVNWR